MADPQYWRSLLATAAVAACVVGVVALVLAWAGPAGALGIAAGIALFLAWFYGGPRPDLGAGRAAPPMRREPSGK